jgi:hypothetical protein
LNVHGIVPLFISSVELKLAHKFNAGLNLVGHRLCAFSDGIGDFIGGAVDFDAIELSFAVAS